MGASDPHLAGYAHKSFFVNLKQDWPTAPYIVESYTIYVKTDLLHSFRAVLLNVHTSTNNDIIGVHGAT